METRCIAPELTRGSNAIASQLANSVLGFKITVPGLKPSDAYQAAVALTNCLLKLLLSFLFSIVHLGLPSLAVKDAIIDWVFVFCFFAMSVSRNIAVVFVGSEEQVPTVDWYMLFSQRFLKGER
jgi:hypothetical protein